MLLLCISAFDVVIIGLFALDHDKIRLERQKIFPYSSPVTIPTKCRFNFVKGGNCKR